LDLRIAITATATRNGITCDLHQVAFDWTQLGIRTKD